MTLLGIDIGGTQCTLARANEEGCVEEVAHFPTENPSATLQRLLEKIRQLGPGPSPLFGVSCGGPLVPSEGLILAPPNLPGWDRVPICAVLTKRFGGHAYLMNNANACALAEWRYGAGRGCQSMVFLTAGTGMGAGLILDGRIYEGASGDAGEVGHVRLGDEGPVGFGKAGSFEGFCSGGGMARLARLRLGSRINLPEWAFPLCDINPQKIAFAALRGEPCAMEIMEESGRHLGEALSLLIDILNPERIVIGGLFSRCRHLLFPAMRAVLEKETLPRPLAACSIVPAALGEGIGNYAAIAVALHGAAVPFDLHPPSQPAPVHAA